MTPTEFVLWLNGALGVMGDTPTPEQMAKIRDKLGEAIGKITADRLLERADEQVKLDKERAKERAEKEAEMAKVKAQMQAMMSQRLATQLDVETFRALTSGSTVKVNDHSQMVEITSGTVTASALARPTKSGGLLGSLLRPAAKAAAK